MSFWGNLAKTAVSSAAKGAATAGVNAAFAPDRGSSGGSGGGSRSAFAAPKARDYFGDDNNSKNVTNSRDSYDDSTKKAKTSLDRQEYLQLPEVTNGENPYELAMMWNDFLKEEK